MSQGKKGICPVCGNYKEGSICQRCNANTSTRSKRWRRGDVGGVRPERKYRKKRPSLAPMTTAANNAKRTEKSFKPIKNFYLALQGRWRSAQEKLTIDIDLTRNRWAFRKAGNRGVVQTWHKKLDSANKLIFVRGSRTITAKVTEDGILMLTGKKTPVPFVYIKAGHEYRLCICCHGKTEWHGHQCKYCGWSFC